MTTPTPIGRLEAREEGLKRELTVRLLGMIGLGQSIGTGLFLGSGISVEMAGPGVILSYVAGAVITLPVMWALAEMTAAHPVAGSFGAYAEHYLNPYAGFITRYTYCMCQMLAVGSQIVAVSIYCRFWFPGMPAWVWILLFSSILILMNAMNVGNFGEFEFWFSLIKVLSIILFILFGLSLFAGIGISRLSFEPFALHGGFLPHGWTGVWHAVTMAMFSFYGLEAAAVSAGEAKDPRVSVPRALRGVLGSLALLYIASIIILVGIVPWNEAGISESPFVKVYRMVGVPAAGDVMNFVVLTAALSSINSNLYATSRILFSLARSGQAPSLLGKLTRRGIPLNAVLTVGMGLLAAAAVQMRYSDSAFVYMLGAALFGGLFSWVMIFVTHLAFRNKEDVTSRVPPGARMPGYPATTVLGLTMLLAVMVTMAFIPKLSVSWITGIPWLIIVSIIYLFYSRSARVLNRKN